MPRAADDPTDGLQLERADVDEAAVRASCAICARPLADAYFQLNGRPICPRCCDAVRTHVHGGSGWVRAARATAAGLAAAAAGTIIYYAILAATGVEIGIIAILVGFLVGKAVSWGANGRGGWKYQTLAMVLTYLSIVSAYVPLVVNAVANRQPAAPGFFLDVVLLVAFAAAMPFRSGASNILGLVIIGIGVYEAWKFNRRRPIVVTGPYRLSSSISRPSRA